MSQSKTVPREPTLAMLEAGSIAADGGKLTYIWKDMYDAATAQAAPGELGSQCSYGTWPEAFRAWANEQQDEAYRVKCAELSQMAADLDAVRKAFHATMEREEKTDAALAAARAQAEKYECVIEWALGQGGSFPPWPPTMTITGGPKYWWRKELRERFSAVCAHEWVAHLMHMPPIQMCRKCQTHREI